VTEREGRFLPCSELGFLITANRDAIGRVLGRYGIRDVAVFGSVARGEDGPDSDIDLAVEIPSDMGLIGLAKAERELTALLGVDVDLVPSGLMRPSVRSTAAADLVPL
jgi:predicted nucleotidyltransferase